MKILQLFRCAMGRHERDRRRAVHDGRVFNSVCMGCGKPMLRDLHGWTLKPKGQSDDRASD